MILLSGASGHLGRATAEAFARLGATDRVVLGSRDPSKLDDLAARGFAVRRYDFDDAAALAAAMDGIGTLVLISGDTPNDVAVAQHGRAIDAAKAAGAAVIYTSITDPGPAAIFDVARKHGGTESLLAWTYISRVDEGAPFPTTTAYLGTILRGATEHGLSEDWIRYLQDFPVSD